MLWSFVERLVLVLADEVVRPLCSQVCQDWRHCRTRDLVSPTGLLISFVLTYAYSCTWNKPPIVPISPF
ncbi:hypothetical protein SEVIR_3G037250v4 [Setaria viridis]